MNQSVSKQTLIECLLYAIGMLGSECTKESKTQLLSSDFSQLEKGMQAYDLTRSKYHKMINVRIERAGVTYVFSASCQEWSLRLGIRSI